MTTVVGVPGEPTDGPALLMCLGCGCQRLFIFNTAPVPSCAGCLEPATTEWVPLADLVWDDDGRDWFLHVVEDPPKSGAL